MRCYCDVIENEQLHSFYYIVLCMCRYMLYSTGLVCAQVYGCGVICRPLLGTTGTITRIVRSVTKGGGVSTGSRDKTYSNYTWGVHVSQWYRKHTTKGVPTPHVAKGGRVSTGGQGESGGCITECG